MGHGNAPVIVADLEGQEAGVPTVCSCGTMGEWNHTVREYVMADSLYERAKLFAGALLRMERFENR